MYFVKIWINLKNKMKVSVLGLGYVGLPLACAIASKTKHEVAGYDTSEAKVQMIRRRECPIDDIRCAEDLQDVEIKASSDKSVLKGSDFYIVCVPTPVLDDYIPDLNPVKNAVNDIAESLEPGQIVVIESTINPGVCEEIVIPILEDRTGLKAGTDFDVAHCPERINPGDPKYNVYNIPRNIGSTRPEATAKAAAFYRTFIDAEINEMPDLKTTEATKIIENTFRDINIAFVNELARSFDVLGIDILAVIQGASNKPFAFLPHFPGCGVGGHCIPVDPYYLIARAEKSGFDHKFLKLARQINNSMPNYTVDLLMDALNEREKPLKRTKVGILGLSYKANVGDLRESPALKILDILEKKGAEVYSFDPFVQSLSNADSIEDLLEKSYAVIIAADHDKFRNLQADAFKKAGVEIIIDGKNCLDKDDIEKIGIYYKGIGH